MEKIKPCPFCGSEDIKYSPLAGCVFCEDCHTYGPRESTDEDAIRKWNAAPRKEDVKMEEHYGSCLNCKFCPCENKTPGTLWCSKWEEKEDTKMEKSCRNCIHASLGIEHKNKWYCNQPISRDYKCNWWDSPNPFSKIGLEEEKTCKLCKHSYTDGYDLCCGHEIGSLDYVCDKWEKWKAMELEPSPLNSEDSSVKPFIDLARDELDVIRTLETKVNEYQMAAEEAAELAQAMLKYCRVCKHGSYTPLNPKDAIDAVIEEYADLLLAMEASFPRCEGSKMFYNNLERVYKEKAKRWAERLKEREEE